MNFFLEKYTDFIKKNINKEETIIKTLIFF